MGPITFYEKVGDHLMDGRLMPPVVGRVGSLRIAAVLMRKKGEEGIVDSGIVLLANTKDRRKKYAADETCLKLIGEITVDRYMWEVGAAITTERLARLIGEEATAQLAADSIIGQSSEGERVIDLVVRNPGAAPAHLPALNGIPFEKW